MSTRRHVKEVIRENADRFLALSGVEGIAEGEWQGQPCVLILISDPALEQSGAIPTELEGYLVRTETSGELKAY